MMDIEAVEEEQDEELTDTEDEEEEMTTASLALEIVRPTNFPGTSIYQEGFVQLCRLIKFQQETADPALFTTNMQVNPRFSSSS